MATTVQAPLEPSRADLLRRAADFAGTPSYAYLLDVMLSGSARCARRFQQFDISFAAKSNPNVELLRALLPAIDTIDASSIGEVERALQAGFSPGRISFSRQSGWSSSSARRYCCGRWCASRSANGAGEALARARVRRQCDTNQSRHVPQLRRQHGRQAKPIGIDEEDLTGHRPDRKLDFISLEGSTSTLARTLSMKRPSRRTGISAGCSQPSRTHRHPPRVLIFGSGFGIPYIQARTASTFAVSALVAPLIDGLRADRRLRDARLALEMGRFLWGPVATSSRESWP